MSNQHLATSWLGSSPEARRQQLDSAIEYSLEQAILERPEKPFQCMAQKLRNWDDAVNGSWPLKKLSVQVFTSADRDGSGTIDVAELAAQSSSRELADAMLRGIDVDVSRSINLAEWLVYMKHSAAVSQDGASALLASFTGT